MNPLDEACMMLDGFTSVGATHFDVTFLDIDGGKRGFRRQQTARQLKRSLPLLFPGLTERRNSLVVRPRAEDGVTLVQIDDLDRDALRKLENAAFLTLSTSPGNYQGWLAVMDATDAKSIARRLRKGAGADPSASGATRVAGTVNYKRKYEPDFPTVSIDLIAPGRIVTPEQLQNMGLLAPPETARPAPPLRVSAFRDRQWPDYQRCVEGVHPNHANTGPDISRADFFWCLLAAQRGWSAEDIAARLKELSPKARDNGESYARLTARKAAAAASRGRAV